MSKHASRFSRSIVVIVSLVALALLVPLSSALASGSAADATNGQALFQANCVSCHGANAAGGIKVGSATSADLRWAELGPTYHNNPSLVSRAILQGLDQDGQQLDTAMPRFSGQLSQSQADDIVAYLQTLASGLPKTGEPVDGQVLPWIALAAAVIVAGGLRLRRIAR